MDVNVEIDIQHNADRDLDIFLIGPNGTRVELSTDNGGTGNDFTDTILDDEAAQTLQSGNPPFTGTFKPEGSLAALDGIPAAGTWKLEVTDDAANNVGNLLGWRLDLTVTVPPVCNVCDALLPPRGGRADRLERSQGHARLDLGAERRDVQALSRRRRRSPGPARRRDRLVHAALDRGADLGTRC